MISIMQLTSRLIKSFEFSKKANLHEPTPPALNLILSDSNKTLEALFCKILQYSCMSFYALYIALNCAVAAYRVKIERALVIVSVFNI